MTNPNWRHWRYRRRQATRWERTRWFFYWLFTGRPHPEHVEYHSPGKEEPLLAQVGDSLHPALADLLHGQVAVTSQPHQEPPKDGTTCRFKAVFELDAYWCDDLKRWVLVRPLHLECLPTKAEHIPKVTHPTLMKEQRSGGRIKIDR